MQSGRDCKDWLHSTMSLCLWVGWGGGQREGGCPGNAAEVGVGGSADALVPIGANIDFENAVAIVARLRSGPLAPFCNVCPGSSNPLPFTWEEG